MIDNFALALTHGLMLIAAWRLWRRDDFDSEPSPRDLPPHPRGMRDDA